MPNPPSVRTEGDVLVLTWPDAGVRAEARSNSAETAAT
jgi:hypothetical protein